MNDPSLSYEKPESSKTNLTPYRKINVKKTEFAEIPNCPIYNTPHTLNECRNFRRRKPLKERNQILLMCFKCCESKTHVYNTCDANLNCSKCGSERHSTGMHTVPRNNQQMHYGATPRFVDGMSTRTTPILDGGEQPSRNTSKFDSRETDIHNKCTTVCGDSFSGRSCAKTVLVNVYHKSDPNKLLTLYAIVDVQSNCTLARS